MSLVAAARSHSITRYSPRHAPSGDTDITLSPPQPPPSPPPRPAQRCRVTPTAISKHGLTASTVGAAAAGAAETSTALQLRPAASALAASGRERYDRRRGGETS